MFNTFKQKSDPDGKTRNEIDFVITDRKVLVKYITAPYTLGMNDHRLSRANVKINVRREKIWYVAQIYSPTISSYSHSMEELEDMVLELYNAKGGT